MDAYRTSARFYEAEYGQFETDVAFFARRGVAGHLLVLGCGTGRVGRRLRSERRVTGLDLSEPMLEIARRMAPDVSYVQGDMRNFDLGEFAEIIAPNGAFNFLLTRADQQRCLQACHRALPPGAPLTIDCPMPDFKLIGVPHSPEKRAWAGEVDGHEAVRTREVLRQPARQRLEIFDRYYLDSQLVAESPKSLRWILPAEAEWMLEANGFAVEELLGDYSGKPVTDTSPRLLVRALRL